MTRPLEQAVAAIVCTFQEYAGRCGDKYKICQSELKELLQKELPTWAPKRTDGAAFQKLMSNLDSNRDNGADLQGYCTFLPCIATTCSEFSEGCPDKCPRKK
ncbi:protein S100-A4 isoform X2 [Meriones unguiculatus]|uniref:protein S100-A4 isoform X2 n=1 Tax=Meriones unguiculatus TaxID=10047 RepID=UPI000B4F6516|nr:protein S100-A4 isoform X2 [Meriones unguiculatus]